MSDSSSNASSRAILRNTLAQYGSLAANIVLGIVLTPVLIRSLGIEAFGVYTLVLALSGYIGLGELGVGTATVRRIAAELSRDDPKRLAVIASTTRAIYLGTVAVGLILTVLATLIIGRLVPGATGIADDAQVATLIYASCTAIIFVFQIYPALLVGSGRSDLLAVAGTTINLIGTIVQIGIAVLTRDLRAVAAAGGLTLLVTAIASRHLALRKFPRLTMRLTDARVQVAKELLLSSWRNAAIAISALAATNADVLIIGAFLSVGAVAAYGVATRVANLVSTLTFRMSEVLVPAYAHQGAVGNRDRLYAMFLECSLASFALALPAAVILIAYGDPLLTLWLGKSPSGTHQVLVLVAITLVIAVPGGNAFFVLSGIDELKFAVRVSIVGGFANAAIGIAITPVIGLTGPAIATLVLRFVDVIFITTHVCRILGRSAWAYFRAFGTVALPPAFVLALLASLMHHWTTGAPSWAVLLECSSLGLVNILIFGLSLGKDRRGKYLAIVRRRLS